MPKLGPNSGGGDDAPKSLPGGRYVLAMTALKRNRSKTSGNDYLRTKLEVCSGPAKGSAAWVNLSCDLSREGTVRRWQILMDSCGVADEFEIGSTSEGNDREGDKNIRDRFFGKPFVAELKRERREDFESNDIDKFIFPKYWTDEEREVIAEWAFEYAQKRAARDPDPGRYAGPPPEDDFATPAGGDRYDSFQDAGQYDDGGFGSGGGDGDIPF